MLRAFVLVGVGLLAACGSSSQGETPKPALVVDCHGAPPSTTPPAVTCGGVCIAHDGCSDVAWQCPAGFIGMAGVCDDGATCCVEADSGAADAGPIDASADSSDAPPG
jgi:hypothetical protein